MRRLAMVSIVANGPSCALVDARRALGWDSYADRIEVCVPDDARASKLFDTLESFGLSVSMFLAAPEYR